MPFLGLTFAGRKQAKISRQARAVAMREALAAKRASKVEVDPDVAAARAQRVREHAQAWAAGDTSKLSRREARKVARRLANPQTPADIADAARAAGMSVADYTAAQTLLAAKETARATSAHNSRDSLDWWTGRKRGKR
jgi:hypothetical protein